MQNPNGKSPSGNRNMLIGVGIAALVAFFVSLAVIGAAAVNFVKTAMGSQNSGSAEAKHDESKEGVYLGKIAADERARNSSQLMQDEFDYADWLAGADRETDAVTHFKKSAEIAKGCGWDSWYASSLERQSRAEHKFYIRASNEKPSIALIDEAVKLAETKPDCKENLGDWRIQQALVYADNEKFAAAEASLKSGLDILQKDSTKKKDFSVAMLAGAQVYLREGKSGQAAESIFTAAEGLQPKQFRSAFKVLSEAAFSMDRKGARKEALIKARNLLKDSNYAELNKTAAALRGSRAETPSGRWDLGGFYDGLSCADGYSDEVWNAHFKNLRDWIAKHPDSSTARVALATSLTDYAWRARGGGWSDTVSDKGNDHFEERLKEAQAVLAEARACKEQCPYWAHISQTVALGQGVEPSEYEKLVAGNLKKWPYFNLILFDQSWYLQPRWYGEEGQWAKVAASEADKLGGPAGDELYSQITWGLVNSYGNVFKEAGADPARTKRGLASLAKKSPNSPMLTVVTAYTAWFTNDRALQKDMVK